MPANQETTKTLKESNPIEYITQNTSAQIVNKEAEILRKTTEIE